ncbi:succinate dehydrogenase, cytochrome b556 subunit, partial [Pseudomonas sp. NPDC089530]|uniref:succinate dehydrogenase, cytochrome b556 subunit n=1 Tax=Pseudomonas sp. NPDC089530 TaxID=3390651 RepID=UPI003CFC0206
SRAMCMILIKSGFFTLQAALADVRQAGRQLAPKLVIWGILSALLYHLVAGVRHLIMDMGIGETLEGGKLGSKIVIAVSVVVIVLAGVWIW